MGGVVVILFGLATPEIIRGPWLYSDSRSESRCKTATFASSALVGLFFAAGWSSCISATAAQAAAPLLWVLAPNSPWRSKWCSKVWRRGWRGGARIGVDQSLAWCGEWCGLRALRPTQFSCERAHTCNAALCGFDECAANNKPVSELFDLAHMRGAADAEA
ncbi:hypothetical protein EMGBS3_11710 [Anaerolineaceae bacterium]|nr:hypothetical protein EMGBS3_11710 [Anaerolineaceae bacterium]